MSGDALIQVVVSGLTLGATYAVSAIGLALLWGTLGMLNMAQGALLAIGGYVSFAAVSLVGFPWFFGLPASIVAGILIGLLFYHLIVRWMFRGERFEMNIIIATVSIAIIVENVLIKIFTAYPKKQPFFVEGGMRIQGILLPNQTLLIIGISIVLTIWLAWLLTHTRMGRAIRATAQNQDAAQLVGISTSRVYIHVLIVASVIASVSGTLLTSVTLLSPHVGHDPMLKAFITCAIAGLGSLPGAVFAAIILGLFESAIQYLVGASYGFPAMLALVIVALIWRPYGVFGRSRVTRG